MQAQATLGSSRSKLKIFFHRCYHTLPGPACAAMASEQGPSQSYTGAADDDVEDHDEQLVVSRAALEDVI